MPSTETNSSRTVMRSARAWHGWWVSESLLYHGDVGRAGELFQVPVVEGADHDGVDVAGQDAARVRRRLAFADLDLLGAQVERVAAELVHPYLEGDAGPADGRKTIASVRPRRGL